MEQPLSAGRKRLQKQASVQIFSIKAIYTRFLNYGESFPWFKDWSMCFAWKFVKHFEISGTTILHDTCITAGYQF